jgi:hypothetical protein
LKNLNSQASSLFNKGDGGNNLDGDSGGEVLWLQPRGSVEHQSDLGEREPTVPGGMDVEEPPPGLGVELERSDELRECGVKRFRGYLAEDELGEEGPETGPPVRQ